MSSRSLHVFLVSLPHSIRGWSSFGDHQPWLCEDPSPVPGHPQQIHTRWDHHPVLYDDDINDDVQEQVSAVGPAAGRAAPLTCLSVDTCMWSMSQIGRTATCSCLLMTQVKKFILYFTSPLLLNFNVITVQTFTIAHYLIYSCIKWIDHIGSVHPHTSL